MAGNQTIKIYLAGRFIKYYGYSDWRDYLIKKTKEKLEDSYLDKEIEIIFYDPRTDTPQGGGFAAFNHFDKEAVLKSDIVFFFDLTPNNVQEDPGAVNEATIGIENGKVVIFCTEMSVIHPMFGNYCSGAIAIGMDAGIEWILSFAIHGLKSLEAYHEMVEKRKQLKFTYPT